MKVFTKSSIFIPESKQQDCFEAPESGIGILFGATESKCFDITIPSQTLENVAYAGGKISQYVTASELQKGKLRIYAKSVPLPTKAEDVSKYYNQIELKSIIVEAV